MKERTFDGTVKLQGLYCPRNARKAKNIIPGDILAWNFGHTSKVLNLEFSKTGKTVNITFEETENGKIYSRKFGSERLIAVQ